MGVNEKMANKFAGENGKATRFHGGKEASASGRKGGKASGIARKKYSSLREAFKAYMTDEDRFQIYQGLVDKAKKGDVRAATFLRDTMGEKPSLQQNMMSSEIVLRVEGGSQEEAESLFG